MYNVACGTWTSLNGLIALLKEYLSTYNTKISDIKLNYGPVL